MILYIGNFRALRECRAGAGNQPISDIGAASIAATGSIDERGTGVAVRYNVREE